MILLTPAREDKIYHTFYIILEYCYGSPYSYYPAPNEAEVRKLTDEFSMNTITATGTGWKLEWMPVYIPSEISFGTCDWY